MTNIGCDSQPLLGFILHCYQHVYICFDFWLVTWRMFLVIWRFVRQMPDGNHCFWKSWLLTKYQFLEPGTLAWPSRLSYLRFHWWQSSNLYLSILVHHPTIEIAKKCVNLHRVHILQYKIVHQLDKSTLAWKKVHIRWCWRLWLIWALGKVFIFAHKFSRDNQVVRWGIPLIVRIAKTEKMSPGAEAINTSRIFNSCHFPTYKQIVNALIDDDVLSLKLFWSQLYAPLRLLQWSGLASDRASAKPAPPRPAHILYDPAHIFFWSFAYIRSLFLQKKKVILHLAYMQQSHLNH